MKDCKVFRVVAAGGSGGSSKLPLLIQGDEPVELVEEDFAGCTKVRTYAFNRCSNLTKVVLPSTVTEIEGYAFQNCTGLTSITVPNSVTSIGTGAFGGSGIVELDIPAGASIGTSLCSSAQSLESVVVRGTRDSIPMYTFKDCWKLTHVELDDNTRLLDNEAFNRCKALVSITLPSQLQRMNGSVFYQCESLKSVVVPSRVDYIGNFAFYGCTSLESITILRTTSVVALAGVEALQNTNNCPIYVPADKVDSYKAASNWSTYAARIQAIPA